jgi:hypothetical protein
MGAAGNAEGEPGTVDDPPADQLAELVLEFLRRELPS